MFIETIKHSNKKRSEYYEENKNHLYPCVIPIKDSTDELFDYAVEAAQKLGLLYNGDLVVITAGLPLGVSGTTNLLKVHVVGDVLVSGSGVTKKVACGEVCVCKNEKEALKNCKEGNILVIAQTSNAILDVMKKAAAIVTEQDNINSHAAIVGLALEKPVIIGASHATQLLRSGTHVKVDSVRGIVCSQNKNAKK